MSELKGSKLAERFIEKGMTVVCYVGDDGDENTSDLNIALIQDYDSENDEFITSTYDRYKNAVPVDAFGNVVSMQNT